MVLTIGPNPPLSSTASLCHFSRVELFCPSSKPAYIYFINTSKYSGGQPFNALAISLSLKATKVLTTLSKFLLFSASSSHPNGGFALTASMTPPKFRLYKLANLEKKTGKKTEKKAKLTGFQDKHPRVQCIV
eukprot:TRINITY_DN7_c0_g1_i3.p1 TRINITY_DN7_c0_g1~~TRINITY_DN7_c0_g1_i3.p1  ORF type:complete len:132 (+),score=8.16 TRINITY_DN7_c0_g1_i3:82-477(+)